MRLFLTLCTLAAVAYGKPQYNYGTGVSGTVGGFSTASRNDFGQSPSNTGLSGFSHEINKGSTVTGFFNSGAGISSNIGVSGFNTAGPSGVSGFTGFLGNSGVSTSQQQQQQQQRAQFEAPIVHKQFITVSAPEDNDALERSKHLVIGRPQKNYRVVFIKAPSASSANVKLSAEYAPKEEKTVIYVLTKKDSSLEVNDIATPAPTQPSKPEVFFIKYKTEQEAQHAQQEIQAQYDKIEGTSEHINGGVAPQKSVVGILDGGNGGAGISHESTHQIQTGSADFNVRSGATTQTTGGSSYLPPSH